MNEPSWILRPIIDIIHDMQLSEHGGAPGVRDEYLLESALDRPQNLYNYQECDLFDLAACYAFGLVRNHPFVDGNKRTAFLAAYIFLKINGVQLTSNEVSATRMVLDLASGEIDAENFARWMRENSSC